MSDARPAAPAQRADLLQDLLARGSLATLRARGGSMWPALRDGDVLTVAPLSHPPVRGEVVLALRGGALFAHRVLSFDGAQALLRGDALPRAEAEFARADLLGRVVRVRRGDRVLPEVLYSGALPLALRPLTRAALRLARALRRWTMDQA